MAMKQTQTKMFDFSDVGLDFCAGSKNLFPDRFKMMLALGYNTKTVSSVSVTGNQVVLTYGVSHGYVADRVLKLNASNLNGEYVIDSVTSNTVTITIDNAPASVSGGFTTFVAPLGWQLVYEQANIHIYKFKALDESDLYLRLCFQNQAARRNCISPCVGKSVDLATGFITDTNSLNENKSILIPADGFKFEFSRDANATSNGFTYSQGYSTFGKGVFIGSVYHLVMMTAVSVGSQYINFQAILPTYCHQSYNQLGYPVVIGHTYGSSAAAGLTNTVANMSAYVSNVSVAFDVSTQSSYLFALPQATASFLNLDTFNTTTAAPISLYELSTKQHLGFVAGGAYVAKYASSNTPTINKETLPQTTKDIDLNSNVYLHCATLNGNSSGSVFFAIPIEEIKID